MAIPYNPSSFATNKTILQAIEELKNYLKDNPCYKVYYVNAPYVVGTYTYNLSDVDDPDDTMTEYDVVFFTNSYYAKVIVKDTNTFDIDPAVSFKGDTGANGVSVSGATINASGHLIITLSDGNTIDAGSVVISYDNTVEITANSGTLTNDDYNKLLSDDSHIKYNSDVYYKNSESSAYIYFFHLTSGGHAAHKQTVRITKATKEFLYSENFFMIDEDSITATNVAGEVLMSNGDGTASWGTAGGGGSQLYCHNILMINSVSATYQVNINLEIISNSSTQLTYLSLLSKLYSDLHTSANTMKVANGTITISNVKYQIIGIYRDSSSRFGFAYFNDGKLYVDDNYSYYNITDNVITL